MNILITGVAGFIGFHLAKRLLETPQNTVIGIDNISPYYDTQLKEDRLSILKKYSNFIFYKNDICQKETFEKIHKHNPTHIVHLAAQAGVRYSLTHPQSYIDTNITGTLNVLEFARHASSPIKHMLYASSSSVYGTNKTIPFTEDQTTETPVSLYAASKKANEMMAHSYSHLFQIPLSGFRFFTVYGPWGRPDMAIHIFATKIMKGDPIPVFNHGNMLRDFTYVDDIVQSLEDVLEKPPRTTEDKAPHQVFNIGAGKPENLMDMIHTLEENLEKKAHFNFMPMQPGDVEKTYANNDKIMRYLEKNTKRVTIDEGLKHFCTWFKKYYL